METIGLTLEQKIMNLQGMISQRASSEGKRKSEYQCNICHDSEWIIDTKTNTAAPCKCQEAKRYKRILDASGISKAFQQKTFNGFATSGKPKIVEQAKKTALDYAQNIENEKSIAFIGKVGSGKTHLAAAIANELMAKGIGVLYENYRDMLNKLKQSVLDEENYQRQMQKYKNATVLFIDDLFKGMNDTDVKYVYEVIDHRYFTGKRVIITSERKVTEWLEIDEAIGSRLYEMCKGRIVEFTEQGLNYRLNG